MKFGDGQYESKQSRNNMNYLTKKFFNKNNIKKIFDVSTSLFEAIHPFVEKQTLFNAANMTFSVGKVIINSMYVWGDDFFTEGWEAPYSSSFSKIILASVSKLPKHTIKIQDGIGEEICFIQLNENTRIGYFHSKNDCIGQIYVENDVLLHAKEIIKNQLWKFMKYDNIVLKNEKSRNNEYEDSSFDIAVDDVFMSMPSARANEYVAYMKKCIAANVPRSVLLYGPPGTGKSTFARTVVSSLGFKSFRIRVDDVGSINTNVLFEAIEIFKPDAIIIDDFDRASSQSSMLECLEHFQKNVKLIIATVNDRKKLDEAIIRPGRFDELLQINKMDADVVKFVLGESCADAFDVVKDWPIAFIQEYITRRTFMSTKEAEESMKELARRVARLSIYDDEDENDEVIAKDIVQDNVKQKKNRHMGRNFSLNFLMSKTFSKKRRHRRSVKKRNL